MNWGTGITITIVAFVSLIASLIYVAGTGSEATLVATNYYEQEIAYQSRINDLQRTTQQAQTPTINRKTDTLTILFKTPPTQGHIALFRPAADVPDQELPISLNALQTAVPLQNLAAGKWKLLISWQVNAQHYYAEHILFI